MRKVLIGLVMMSLVVLIIPAQAVAMSPGYCDAGTSKNMKVLVIRSDGNSYDAIIGDANARPLGPCSPSPSNWSNPAVLPANIQGSLPGQIVQLGYMQCSNYSGVCGLDVPSDVQIHFVITQNDWCNGCFQKADSWAGLPIVGHRYRFKITSDWGVWNYCIRDLTTGGAYVCEPGGQGQGWGSGPMIWWGTEVTNTQALMGPAIANGYLSMYWMQYSKLFDSSWLVTTDNVVAKTGDPHPTAYHNYVYSQNYTNDALESHTD